MRILHAESGLEGVGLTINEDATTISEFDFLKLEREWDDLVSAVLREQHAHAASSGLATGTTTAPPATTAHNHTSSSAANASSPSSSSFYLLELPAEQIARPLQSIPVTHVIDKYFGGLKITRDIIIRSPNHNQLAANQGSNSNNSHHGMPPRGSSNNNNNSRFAAAATAAVTGQPHDVINFKELLYALFPVIPEMNIERFFLGFVPESVLLTLKGSLSLPPYVRFAPSAAKSQQQQKQNQGSSRSSGRGGGGRSTTTSALFASKRIVVRGPSFEEMTGSHGGRLDLATLASHDFRLGCMLFPQELFESLAGRFGGQGGAEYRASFFEVLRVLFPRVPEPLLRCYEVTTPHVNLLAPLRDLFITRNPSVFRRPATPTPSQTASSQQQQQASPSGGRNDGQRQQEQQSRSRSRDQATDNSAKFASSALLGSPSASTRKSTAQEQLAKSKEQANAKNDSKSKQQQQGRSAMLFLPQILPAGALQCVAGEACESVQNIIAMLQQQPQNSNNSGNSTGALPLHPTDRQWLTLADYKEMCFESKHYLELIPGVPLTYHIFVAIERAFPNAGGAGKGGRQRGTRNSGRQHTGAIGGKISLVAVLRFLFPNAPLPLFVAFLDALDCREQRLTEAQRQPGRALPIADAATVAQQQQNDETAGFFVVGSARQHGSVVASLSPSNKSNHRNNEQPQQEPQQSPQQQQQQQPGAVTTSRTATTTNMFELQNAMLLRDPSATTPAKATMVMMAGPAISVDIGDRAVSNDNGDAVASPLSKPASPAVSSSPRRRLSVATPTRSPRSSSRRPSSRSRSPSTTAIGNLLASSPSFSGALTTQQQLQRGNSSTGIMRRSSSLSGSSGGMLRRKSVGGSTADVFGSLSALVFAQNNGVQQQSQQQQVIRLGNGVYTSVDLARQMAVMEACEKAALAEKLKREKRKEQRNQSKRKANALGQPRKGGGQNNKDENQHVLVNGNLADHGGAQDDEAGLVVCDGHNPFGDDSLSDASSDDDKPLVTPLSASPPSQFRQQQQQPQKQRQQQQQKPQSPIETTTSPPVRPNIGPLGESVSAAALHRYRDYERAVECELDAINAPIRKRAKERQQKIAQFEQQVAEQQQRLQAVQRAVEDHALMARSGMRSPMASAHIASASLQRNNNNRSSPSPTSSPAQRKRRGSPSARGRGDSVMSAGGGRETSGALLRAALKEEESKMAAMENELARLRREDKNLQTQEREQRLTVNNQNVQRLLLHLLGESQAGVALEVLKQQAAALTASFAQQQQQMQPHQQQTTPQSSSLPGSTAVPSPPRTAPWKTGRRF